MKDGKKQNFLLISLLQYLYISEIELLGRKDISKEEITVIQELLENCLIIDLNSEIKARAIQLKQVKKIKLPDSLVAATSQYFGLTLLTADKGFENIPNLDVFLLEI